MAMKGSTVASDRAGQEIPSDYREIVNYQIDRHGWRYDPGRKHPVLYPADPVQPILTVPTTPSDRRALRNFVSGVCRRGGTWPPP